jgi:hypothetical protein
VQCCASPRLGCESSVHTVQEPLPLTDLSAAGRKTGRPWNTSRQHYQTMSQSCLYTGMWEELMGHVSFSREIPVIPASNRNTYRNISGGKVQLGHRADSLTATCEPTV